jgi:hypothetical protein
MANEFSVRKLGPSHSTIGYVWLSGSIAECGSDIERFAIHTPFEKPVRSNTLLEEYHIYMAGNSRVSIAGLNTKNVDYVARSIAEVLARESSYDK